MWCIIMADLSLLGSTEENPIVLESDDDSSGLPLKILLSNKYR